jgi:hypothetical protein
VTWSVARDLGYVGWAPLPPTWIWRGDNPVRLGYRPHYAHAYVPRGSLFSPTLRTRLVPHERARLVDQHARPYVRPGPEVLPRAFADRPMHGPPPAELGIAPQAVARPTDRGVNYARSYARPSTAQALGARPAAPHVGQAPPANNPRPGKPIEPPQPIQPVQPVQPKVAPPAHPGRPHH